MQKFQLRVWRYDHIARVVDESLTPITDEVKDSPVVLDEWAPGDGPG